MNMNFNSFLSNSLRILNIAKKSLPLIEDISPTIKSIKKGINKLNIKKKITPIKEEQNKKTITNSNSLSFFK